MKLFLLSLTLTYAAAVSLQLGSKACSWGPTYWCSHVEHAKECRAVKHCMDTVWKRQIIHPQSTEECTYCQLGFNELRDIMARKDIQDDIAKYVSDICNLLPNPDWKSTCTGIVSEDLPIIIEMLDEKINSEMICATIGLCSGLEDTYSPYGELAKQKTEVTTPNTTCADCNRFFKDLQAMVTSKETENELEQLLNQVICARLPSLTDLCNEAVKGLIPDALQFLADQLDPNVACRVFGFCVSSYSTEVIHIKNIFKHLKGPLKTGSSEECEACKDLLTELDNSLRDQTTQADIKSYIEMYVCDNLGSLAGVCKQVVEQYLPNIFELVVNELDPKTVCETIGMCTVPSGSHIMPAVELVPAKAVGQSLDDNPVFCDACKFFLGKVKEELEKNGTVQTVEEFIDKICERLPSDELRTQCKSFVDEYGSLVVTEIDKDLDPAKVCSEVKACSAKLDKVALPNTAVDCDLCVLGLTEIEEIVSVVPQDTIMNDARGLCAYLPGNLSATCTNYVNSYLPLAIQILKSKEDPKSLCHLAGICTTSTGSDVLLKPYMTKPIPEDKDLVQPESKVKSSVTCEVCTYALDFLKAGLAENATEADVRKALDSLCEYLPSQYSAECKTLVDTYSEQIIQLILEQDAHTVCLDIKLCSSTLRQTSLIQAAGILSPVDTLPIIDGDTVQDTKKQNVKVSLTCEICDTALVYLKVIVGQNATEEEIKQELASLCSYLPQTLTTECQSLVKDYGEKIIQLFLKNLQPHAVCIEIGLCQATAVEKVNAGIMSPVDTLPLVDAEENTKVTSTEPMECDACMFVMNAADKALQQQKTQEAIKEAMLAACKLLPTPVQSSCTDTVKKDYMVVINYLILSESPDAICKALKFCSASMSHGAPTQEKLEKLTGEVCVICEFVIKGLDSLLEKNASQAEIEAALEKVCSILPTTISSECASFVKQYSPVIIQLLINDIEPSKICTLIGLCTSDSLAGLSTKVKILPPTSKVAIDKCEVCEYVMTALKDYLSQNRTEQEVEQFLKEACDILPDTVTAQCEDAVKEYLPAIMDLIEQEFTPLQICQQVGFCNSTGKENKLNNEKPEKRPSNRHGGKTDDKLYFKPNLLGQNECTYGPAYWCASQENAKKCNAVEHCMRHVWN